MESNEPKSSVISIVDRLKDPNNSLTSDERMQQRQITGDVGSAVKASLVQLLMGQFNKVAMYDKAINEVMTALSDKMLAMEPNELVMLLGVLTKTSTSEAKNVMDMFKKQGDDFKQIISELQKRTTKHTNEDGTETEVVEEIQTRKIINLAPEKKDKLIRLMQKMERKEEK